MLGIVNAHDFHPRHTKAQIRVVDPEATCPNGDPQCNGNGIAPPDWSVIYDVDPLYNPGIGGTKITGDGVTIMVVGIADISQKDLTAFRTRYGLATNNITKTVVPNTGAAVSDNGAGIEAVLDTEWSGAIAPSATVNYVYVGGDDPNVEDAVFYAIEKNYGGAATSGSGTGNATGSTGTTTLTTIGEGGGCGCRAAGDSEPEAPRGLAAFGALALAGMIRSRRRRD